ncbi:MAG: glycosyltransferase family 1 protein [Parcubacteria group bacterium]|jgi:glycosyltransferase involved in cell wall biosynthesis
MRIGIDIRNIGKQRTGDEVVFFNLVKNLAKIDNENEYLLFTDTADTTVLQYTVARLGIVDKKNFKTVSLSLSFLRKRESKLPKSRLCRFRIKCGMTLINNKFLWNLWTLPNYLRKNPVDAYHTQYITPFFVSKKIKIITHIHDVSFLAFPEFIKKSDLFFLKVLIPMSIKRADKVIAVSEFTKKEIIKYYQTDSEKIKVVYNAVSEDFLKSDYSGNELFAIRKKYNLPEEYILYIGTLQPRKNIPMLIRAFAEVKKRMPEIKLVLAGNRNAHNFDKRIDEEIARLNLSDGIIFSGFVEEEDKSALFLLAKVFVFPSLYEGFGIPILEAISRKISVLASDIPVHREIAEDGALYFNSESIDEMQEKLYNILADEKLRENLINLGTKRLDFFSWKKAAYKLLEVYLKK